MSIAVLGRRRHLVVAAVQPEDPEEPPPASFTPNMPVGFTSQLDQRWNSTAAPVGWSQYFDATHAEATLEEDDGPENATSLGITQKAGSNSGQLAIIDRLLSPDTRRVYVAMAYRLTSNYRFHNSATKVLYPYLTSSGSYRPFEVSMAPLDGRDGGIFQWELQRYYVSNPGFPDYLRNNINDDPLSRGVWNLTEFLFENNAVLDATTGRIRWWNSTHNGTSWNAPVLKADHQGLRVVPNNSGFDGTWGTWQFNVFYGGSGDVPVTVPQTMAINRLLLSTNTEGI